MTTPAQRLHSILVEVDEAHGCGDLPDDVCREVPGNATRIVAAQTLQSIGDRIVDAKTVLPWLLAAAGAPAVLVGLLALLAVPAGRATVWLYSATYLLLALAQTGDHLRGQAHHTRTTAGPCPDRSNAMVVPSLKTGTQPRTALSIHDVQCMGPAGCGQVSCSSHCSEPVGCTAAVATREDRA